MDWGKANVIQHLRQHLRIGQTAQYLSFSHRQWQNNATALLQNIEQTFSSNVIVRSSCSHEDSLSASHAGKFHSELDVDSKNRDALQQAIHKVFNSYTDLRDEEAVLIQAMIESVRIAGVITTRTTPTAAPYYTINYQHTNKTTAITEGHGDSETLIIYRPATEQLQRLEPKLSTLLDAIKEVEQVLQHDALDIEFAIDADNTIWILQARPLTSIDDNQRTNDDDIAKVINDMQTFFDDHQSANPHMAGHRTLYGNMPDVNPAELIGARPRPLAFSLYRELITNEVCALARSTFGYRDMTLQPLLQSLAGQPYVDVRASFNTYIPAQCDEALSHKLANFYLDRLALHPQLHDKVEFDVLITAMSFDFEERCQQLKDYGFSNSEIQQFRDALTVITNKTFEQCQQSLKLLEELEQDYNRIINNTHAPLDRAIQLINSAKQFGTLAFVEVARCGFAAVSFLQAMVKDNIASKSDIDTFMNSLHTVASGIQHDGAAVYNDTLSWEQFIERYGHLRPGTYEITYPRYDDNIELYLRPMVRPLEHTPSQSDLFDQSHVRDYLQQHFKRTGLTIDVDAFHNYLKQSIEAREYAKFLFTRNLSTALEAIAEFGAANGLSREDMAFIDYPTLSNLSPGSAHVSEIETSLQQHCLAGKRAKRIVNAIELPALIRHRDDITAFRYAKSAANFVTQQSTTATLLPITQQISEKSDIAGHIIIVPQADPGFDWIFAYDIAGLITQYGGVNSHMAIRCAELNTPAAIGIGRKRFQEIESAHTLCLDCLGRRLTVIA